MNEMSVNHRIEYVPLTKDLNGNNLLYPIYIPINIDEPEIFAATGRLSKHDYKRTLKILHSKPMLISAGNDIKVQEAGFPFAPLIAALAPIVIPGAIKAVKSLFKKKSSSGRPSGRAYLGRGEDEEEISSEEEIKEDEDEDEDEVSEEVASEEVEDKKSGYIPTNPNIKTLKQLQKIYNSHM